MLSFLFIKDFYQKLTFGEICSKDGQDARCFAFQIKENAKHNDACINNHK